MRMIVLLILLSAVFTGLGCGGAPDAPVNTKISDEERAKKAKEAAEGWEKAQKEGESRRPGGR